MTVGLLECSTLGSVDVFNDGALEYETVGLTECTALGSFDDFNVGTFDFVSDGLLEGTSLGNALNVIVRFEDRASLGL